MTTPTLSRAPAGGAMDRTPLDDNDRAALDLAVLLIRLVVARHPWETSLVICTHVQAAVRDIERACSTRDVADIQRAVSDVDLIRRDFEER